MLKNVKVMSLVLVFLFLLSGITFAGEKTTVTMLYWPGPESEAMQKVIEWYNTNVGIEDGIKVEMLTFSRQGFFDKQQIALAGGTKNFDIAFPPTYILGRLAPDLEPLDAYFEKYDKMDNLKDVYIESGLNSLKYNGQQYALPTDVGHHAMFFRKDLINKLLSNKEWQEKYKEIGKEYLGKEMKPVEPEDWNWDDFITTSLFFTKSINPDSPTLYGTALQMKNLIFNVMIWNDVLWSYGGQLVKNGEAVIDSKAAREALDVYMKIIENNATPPSSINYEFAETNQAFKSGHAAVILQWVAAYNILTDQEKSPQIYDKVGRAVIPAGPEGHKVHVHNLGVGLNKHSDKKEEAFQFLAFLASNKAMKMYYDNGGLPPVKDVLNEEDVNQLARDGFTEYIGAETVPIYEAMAKHLTQAWSEQVSSEEALVNLNEEINKLLKE